MDFYKSVNFGECIVNNDLFAHKMIKLLRLERRMAFASSPKQAWKHFLSKQRADRTNDVFKQSSFTNTWTLCDCNDRCMYTICRLNEHISPALQCVLVHLQ